MTIVRQGLVPSFIGAPVDVIVETPSQHQPMQALGRTSALLRDFVAESTVDSRFPFVLSGDCVSAIGCVAGAQRQFPALSLIWFDAHGDFHTRETTVSGHVGGMPLAMLTGRGDQSIVLAAALDPLCDARVFHVGARDLEPAERAALACSDVIVGERLSTIIDEIPQVVPLWIHFDTDYIDPSQAPAMRYPAAGGPTARHVQSELMRLVRERRVVGLSTPAWAPRLDPDGATARVCWSVIRAVLDAVDRHAVDLCFATADERR